MNRQEAVRFYQSAADQGNPHALYQLAGCYDRGDGVPKDKPAAARHYKLAADLGDEDAQLQYGRCLLVGRCECVVDEQEAVRYLKLAADQGHREAQFDLGVCYYKGVGVTQSKEEAVKYLKLVACNAEEESQLKMLGDTRGNFDEATNDETAAAAVSESDDIGCAFNDVRAAKGNSPKIHLFRSGKPTSVEDDNGDSDRYPGYEGSTSVGKKRKAPDATSDDAI